MMGTLLSTGQDRRAPREGRRAQGRGTVDGNPLSIYTARCAGGDGIGIERILPAERTTFYAYGRQALAEGLRRVGVKSGDRVLMPGLICREVLASLTAVGAVPRFYAVDDNLCVVEETLKRAGSEGAKAVVAVNYFGFPQPLGPFQGWCRSHEAALIEDNAHGFLSADGTVPLGRRGDLGVFSLRKTLTLPNGAALVENRPGFRSDLGESPYRSSTQGSERRYRVKTILKQIMTLGRLRSARAVVAGVRLARRMAIGVVIPPPASDAEAVVPQEAFSPLTAKLLDRCDVGAEVARRRSLFLWCGERVGCIPGVQPLYDKLPDGVAPYAYPFYFQGTASGAWLGHLKRQGLLCLKWPDRLPKTDMVMLKHDRNLMYVSFLW